MMIKIRLTAFSDAAGKFDPNAPLNGNEDNFYIDDNFTDGVSYSAKLDNPVELSPLGCLMVVADGMGGMNAGEVASAIAVDTVKDFFSAGKITPAIAGDHTSRSRYMQQVIVEADRRIKTQAAANADQQGMGSTMIMAWIVGSQMSLVWIGDSRAYRFNPAGGLQLVSRDHSYVQELVNNGVISYEDTFEHPQGNIVTRSLGDPSHSALPESKLVDLFTGDIVLLCSDGLSGVVRDVKTADENGAPLPGDTIEDILCANTDSMTRCREQLMAAAERNHWYDNVTVLLCQILEGAPAYAPTVAARATSITYRRMTPPASASTPAPAAVVKAATGRPAPQPAAAVPMPSAAPARTPQPAPAPMPDPSAQIAKSAKRSNTIFFIMAFIVVLVLGFVWYFFLKGEEKEEVKDEASTEQVNESVEIPERNLPSGSATQSAPQRRQSPARQANPERNGDRRQGAQPAPGKKQHNASDASGSANRQNQHSVESDAPQGNGSDNKAKPSNDAKQNNRSNDGKPVPGQQQQPDKYEGRRQINT